MGVFKMFQCRDCKHQFKDLPEGSLAEMGDINPSTGKIDNPKPVPQECPKCGGGDIDPVIEKGRHKDA